MLVSAPFYGTDKYNIEVELSAFATLSETLQAIPVGKWASRYITCRQLEVPSEHNMFTDVYNHRLRIKTGIWNDLVVVNILAVSA